MTGKGGASFPLGRRDYPNVGISGDVNLNPYFVLDSFCSFCTHDRRQTVNQSCL